MMMMTIHTKIEPGDYDDGEDDCDQDGPWG